MDTLQRRTLELSAAWRDETIRTLVRTNAMLGDEVEWLHTEVARLRALLEAAPPCRVCEVAGATGEDGLCDGCREARARLLARQPREELPCPF